MQCINVKTMLINFITGDFDKYVPDHFLAGAACDTRTLQFISVFALLSVSKYNMFFISTTAIEPLLVRLYIVFQIGINVSRLRARAFFSEALCVLAVQT